MHNNILFCVDTIPLNCRELYRLAEKCWAEKNEYLSRGTIPFDVFSTDHVEHTYSILEKYFIEREYRFAIETIPVDHGTRLYTELVCKTAYLTKEYLRLGNFSDPLCAHYNPRLDKQVIHPGGTRQTVLDLFHEGTIDCYYFNTRGYVFDFMEKLQKINPTKFIQTEEINFALVPDHGSLIPHILSNQGRQKNPTNMINAHNHIKLRFSSANYRIFSNQPIEIFNPWLTTKRKRSHVSIIFKDLSMTLKDQIKAIYLVLAKQNYNSKSLEVRHTI